MAALLFLALFLCITAHTSATYCVCLDGVGTTALQADIDYACGSTKADCSAITQSGACYQPSTVKSHCDYAVNSYYQKMGQVVGSCNFSGSATVTNTLPTTVVSGCTYPASPSQVTAATPTSTTSSPTPTSTTSSPNTNFSSPTTGTTPFAFAPTGSSSFTPSGSRSLVHHTNSVSATLITLFLYVLLVSRACGSLLLDEILAEQAR